MSLDKATEPVRLEKAFEKLIRRHESLRTSFRLLNGSVVQEYTMTPRLKSNILHLVPRPVSGRLKILQPGLCAPLTSFSPLVRVGLIRLPGRKYITGGYASYHFGRDFHEILAREFQQLYDGVELPPLRLQYKDFVEWLLFTRTKGVIKKQEMHWLKVFADEVPVLDLPLDFIRPADRDFDGNSVHFSLNEAEIEPSGPLPG